MPSDKASDCPWMHQGSKLICCCPSNKSTLLLKTQREPTYRFLFQLRLWAWNPTSGGKNLNVKSSNLKFKSLCLFIHIEPSRHIQNKPEGNGVSLPGLWERREANSSNLQPDLVIAHTRTHTHTLTLTHTNRSSLWFSWKSSTWHAGYHTSIGKTRPKIKLSCDSSLAVFLKVHIRICTR